MPEQDWEDHEDDTDLVKNLRKQIRESGKKLTEAEDRAAAAEGKLTVNSLAETLTAKGVNPKAAKWLVKDGVDASDEKAVTEWLEENSDLFPAKAPESETSAEDPTGPDAETVAGHQRVSGTSFLQRPADMNKVEEINRRLPENATPEQVLAEFRKAGV